MALAHVVTHTKTLTQQKFKTDNESESVDQMSFLKFKINWPFLSIRMCVVVLISCVTWCRIIRADLSSFTEMKINHHCRLMKIITKHWAQMWENWSHVTQWLGDYVIMQRVTRPLHKIPHNNRARMSVFRTRVTRLHKSQVSEHSARILMYWTKSGGIFTSLARQL